MYYKLPVKERIELMKSYRKANPDMSYQDMVNDYNTSYKKFGDGGKKQQTRTDIYTDKAAFDKAYKAEMDSANRYNEYINKVKQYQKEGLELKKSFPVSNSILNFMNDPAFANSIYSKPIKEEYYGNPTKSGNVTSQATALVYKKPVVHNVYEPVMTKPIQSSQDTLRHWNFNGPNPVLEYYDKSGKLINKEFYTNAGPGGKRIQPLNK